MLSIAEGDFLRTPDVARLLGVADGTLRAWRSQGIGPSYCQMNGHYGAVRYSLEDLKTWLAEQVVHPSKNKKVHTATAR